jgi:polyferredoxin
MMLEVCLVLGAALALAALFTPRTAQSLLLLFGGTSLLSLAVAALCGPLCGVVVATLYAGALVALMAVWLILAETEEARRDAIYWVAVALMMIALLAVLLTAWAEGASATSAVGSAAREISPSDLLLLASVLVVAAGGAPYVLWGEK